MRSDGAVRLMQLKVSQLEIAKKCAVKQGTVSKWQNGLAKPSYSNRKVMLARYGIPDDSWDIPHVAQAGRAA